MRVLLVDDDERVRDLLDRMLSELGFQVSAACDAAGAVGLLREQAFDVLVTDYLLPDQVGTELAGLAKELQPVLRVVMISGLGPTVVGTAVDALLAKPFRIDQLLTAIEAPPTAPVTT